MLLTKKKNTKQLSASANGPNSKKPVDDHRRKSRGRVNHWAFLVIPELHIMVLRYSALFFLDYSMLSAFEDEIEAPTWADLTLECDSPFLDKDDEWFHISHPFHQLSAEQLISAFSHSGEISINSALDIQAPTSPNLPLSVSKSRGKDYTSQKCEPIVCSFALHKKHQVKGLSAKSSPVNIGYEKAVKNKASQTKVTESFSLKSGSISESTLTETKAMVFSIALSAFSDRKASLRSVALVRGGGDSISIGTSEATDQPGSGLLSTFRAGVRKSPVLRQASRVVINDMRESEGPKSSSGSSVGSSMQNIGTNLKITVCKDKTPDSRNMMSVSKVPIKNVNRAYADKAAMHQAQNISCSYKTCISQEARQARGHSKYARLHDTGNANAYAFPPAPKKSLQSSGTRQFRPLHGGKENQAGPVFSIKSRARMKGSEGAAQNLKALQREMDPKSDKIKVVDTGEKCREVKKSTRMAETVYFR